MTNNCDDAAGGVLFLSMLCILIGFMLGWFMSKATLLAEMLEKRDKKSGPAGEEGRE